MIEDELFTELEIEMHKLQHIIRHEDLTLEQTRVCLDALYEVMVALGDSNVDEEVVNA